MRSTDPDQPSGRGQTYRQGSALAAGGVLAVLTSAFLVLHLSDGGWSDTTPTLISVGVLLGLWTILLRPSVRLSEHGVTLRNIARDVHLSWPAVDLVETRWALTLVTPEGKAYTSWAITAQRPTRSSATQGRSFNPIGGLRGGGAATSEPAALRDPTASAGKVGGAIRRTREQYDDAVSRRLMDEQQPVVTVRPALLNLVALGIAVGCIVAVIAI